MPTRYSTGSPVQTPFGKGTVREIRNNGRVLVEVKGRALVVREAEIAPLDERRSRARPGRTGRAGVADVSGGSSPGAADPTPQAAAAGIDLHGLTVEQALACAERALDEALRADVPELRFIHGKSGGRIRGALHRWLAGIRSVRSFRVDPTNEGVTIVFL